MAGVVAPAVELQAGLRVSLPSSIQVRVADVAEIAAIRLEVRIEYRHFPVGRVIIPLDDRVGAIQYGCGDVEVRILQKEVRVARPHPRRQGVDVKVVPVVDGDGCATLDLGQQLPSVIVIVVHRRPSPRTSDRIANDPLMETIVFVGGGGVARVVRADQTVPRVVLVGLEVRREAGPGTNLQVPSGIIAGVSPVRPDTGRDRRTGRVRMVVVDVDLVDAVVDAGLVERGGAGHFLDESGPVAQLVERPVFVIAPNESMSPDPFDLSQTNQ